MTIAGLFILSVPLFLAPGTRADESHCTDPEDLCADSCETDHPLHCHSDDDCDSGMECKSYWDLNDPGQICIPSNCFCDAWGWSCTDDCTDLCVAVDPPIGFDDERCEELLADETFDGIADCFLAKATVDFVAGTLLIEGTICDAPEVHVGVEGGDVVALNVLDSGESFLLVNFASMTGPTGVTGPTGPQGKSGKGVPAIGNPIPSSTCPTGEFVYGFDEFGAILCATPKGDGGGHLQPELEAIYSCEF